MDEFLSTFKLLIKQKITLYFKYPYWYFLKKTVCFLEGGQKVNFFSINEVNFAEKIISYIEIDSKWFADAVLTIFTKKSQFRDPIDHQIIFM